MIKAGDRGASAGFADACDNLGGVRGLWACGGVTAFAGFDGAFTAGAFRGVLDALLEAGWRCFRHIPLPRRPAPRK